MRTPHIDQNWSFSTRSDLVVVGSNPESADYTNPRGHLFGLLWFVVASNDHGDRRELAVVSSSEPSAIAAVKLANRLNTRLLDLKRLPIGFAMWPEGRPVYGSDAYVEYRIEALKRREREADAALAVDAITRAFDLTPNDWAWRMWADVGSDCGRALPEFLEAEMRLPTPAARALAIRKAMRPLLTDAKQNAREEYPEDYREADDKEDFYSDYMDDISQHIVSEIGKP